MAGKVIKLQVEPLPEGGYLATSDGLPGLVAQGRTVVETLEIAQDVARKLIESYIEHGDPLRLACAISRFPNLIWNYRWRRPDGKIETVTESSKRGD